MVSITKSRNALILPQCSQTLVSKIMLLYNKVVFCVYMVPLTDLKHWFLNMLL